MDNLLPYVFCGIAGFLVYNSFEVKKDNKSSKESKSLKGSKTLKESKSLKKSFVDTYISDIKSFEENPMKTLRKNNKKNILKNLN